jgi:hypothetical protein
MTSQKPSKVQVLKERTINTYSELWHGLGVLLQRSKNETLGSYWLRMSSLILTAFSFEAYLNHIGQKLFACWPIFEKLVSPEDKLDIVCEKIEIDLLKGKRPRQTVRELFKFRNDLAHGRTVTVPQKKNAICDVDLDQYFEEFFIQWPLATWEKYCSENNAVRARDDIKQIMQLIHEKVKPENDTLFGFGMYSASASLKPVF